MLDAALNPSAQGLAVIKKQTQVSETFPEVMNRNRTYYSRLDKCDMLHRCTASTARATDLPL